MTNAVRAFYCNKTGSNEITVSAATGADNLPAGIIVPPGVYNIFGVSVDMTTERLYRVSDFDTRSVQVISYASDFDALVTSIAWVGQIGYGDVTYSPAMLQAVRTRTISTTCGAISNVALNILAQVGIVSRECGGAAFAGFNGYDDGHTLLEVQRDGQWVAFDFLLKYRFFAADGVTPLSLLGLHDALRSNQPVVFSPMIPAIAPADTSKYIWLHDYIRSNTRAWYKRIFELVYQPSGGETHVMYETEAERVSIPPRGSIPIDRATYIANFYAPISNRTFVGQFPNTTSGWGALYTVADTNLQLHAGETVESIGLHLNSPASLKIKILQQITTGSFAVMQSYPFSHPGGGWVDCPIPGGYVVPASGIYRPGISASLGTESFSTIGSRAIFSGELPAGQSGAFSYATNGGICMRWTRV
jgi:hypothetical protein